MSKRYDYGGIIAPNYNPGPGSYSTKLYDLEKRPSYSMGVKGKRKDGTFVPGPGRY